MVQLRPRFQSMVPCHPQQAFEKFRTRLAQPDCPFEGVVLERYISVTVTQEQQHYWSPVLTIQSEAVSGGTLLRGHYGPHPNVWTLLLAVAAILCFSGIFLTMYGSAQVILGEPPWGLLAVPATLLGVAGIYGVALWGQRQAKQQMEDLRSFFEFSVCAQELLEIEPPEVFEQSSCVRCLKLCEKPLIKDSFS